MRTITLVTLLALAPASAQQPGDAGATAFEAASVRRNTSGDARVSMGGRPGTYVASNAPLRMVIIQAYGIDAFQLAGGPGWLAGPTAHNGDLTFDPR